MSQAEFRLMPFFLRRADVMRITGWSREDIDALVEAKKLRKFYTHVSKKGEPKGYAFFYKEDVARLIGLTV